jgi:hypothetical protein
MEEVEITATRIEMGRRWRRRVRSVDQAVGESAVLRHCREHGWRLLVLGEGGRGAKGSEPALEGAERDEKAA